MGKEDKFWRELCEGLELDEAFAEMQLDDRLAARDHIALALRNRIGSFTRAEIEERLSSRDTCWSFADIPGNNIGGRLPAVFGEVAALDAHRQLVIAEFCKSLT